MMQKAYLLICGTVFLLVAGAHLARLVMGWEIMIAGGVVPHWISIPGLLIAGLLSAWGFTLASRHRAM